ncbi:MAG: peptidoglycan-binding protein [Firmicutes bacterium]|nr:peptidoglycan-binding protein [Alicyclobacillaceae bacterium]MCL6497876.1 peptidoglycan-binding protein [Bacillota bacterium]
MARFEETFPPYQPFGSRSLRWMAEPMRGSDVALVQSLFNLANALLTTPLGPDLSISGIFDRGTRDAVEQLQFRFGVLPDGVVGPATFAVLGQLLSPGAPALGHRLLRPGDRGKDVERLQGRLSVFRYASLLGGPADGSFGLGTAAAVQAFAKDAAAHGQTGLPAGSTVGPGTFDALFLYAPAGGRTFSPESVTAGVDVAFAQRLLQELGEFSADVTGRYDAATVSAVRRFQRRHGLREDGVLGPITWFHLGLENPNAAPAPGPVVWPHPDAVKVCCAPLVTATSDLHPYGMVTHVINLREGFESIDVAGNFLPEPDSFGNGYNQYVAILRDLHTAALVAQVPMVPLTSTLPRDWGGSFSPGVKTIPGLRVEIVPSGPEASGPYGPAVLRGRLQPCPGI